MTLDERASAWPVGCSDPPTLRVACLHPGSISAYPGGLQKHASSPGLEGSFHPKCLAVRISTLGDIPRPPECGSFDRDTGSNMRWRRSSGGAEPCRSFEPGRAAWMRISH